MSAVISQLDDYGYLHQVATYFTAQTKGVANLFTTDASGLWGAYLGAFPADERQHHNCNACRRFIENYGGLVTIDEHGRTASPLWDLLPDDVSVVASFGKLSHIVRRAKVTGVFRSSEKVWGMPQNRDRKRGHEWHHLAVTPPAHLVYRGTVLTAGQAAAEKREDFGIVSRGLAEFIAPMVDQALTLLESDQLYRAEKVIGPARFLRDLHRACAANKGREANVTWRAVASAPAGFCHPRSSMVGTLLEDIAAGMGFEDVSKRFRANMNPLQYQRPQAAPTAGNIAQAEALFQKLGLAPALDRRIARLDEIPLLWSPKPSEPPKAAGDGVFGHLTTKGSKPGPGIEIPAITMTLEKFVRTVATTADAIEIQLAARFTGIAITTALNEDAPKLFQWDHPFAHYVWQGGSSPSQYGLTSGWVKLAGITRLPSRWNDDEGKFKHHGDGLILLLDGARETRVAGAALFPENLRGELHGVRSTIESFSRGAKMQGLTEGSAIGVDLRQGSSNGTFPVLVRVTAAGRAQSYTIDRWD